MLKNHKHPRLLFEGHVHYRRHHGFVEITAASFLFLFQAFKVQLVSKYSRSQSDRSLKQFQPGGCPDAVDRRFGGISSRHRTASQSPHRPFHPPCWPIRDCRGSRTLASTRADLPSRFSSDKPSILSAYLTVAALANVVRCILL